MNVLGIDIGGSGIKGAPVDADRGTLLSDRYRLVTPKLAKPDAVAETVAAIADKFDWDGPIGCTVPAIVQKGIARSAANIHPDWIDTHVEELLGGATGLPVFAINDADAAGLASIQFGAARGRRDLVFFMTIGTGIGTAVFIDGTLVPNTEFGHLEIEGMSAEQYCSNRARKRADLSWTEWADRFQCYLDMIERLMSPDLLVIGGGVSRPHRAQKFADKLHVRCELAIEVLENEAGIIGAACAASRRFAGR